MNAGPFERHLQEAIALNRARAPLYAALSGGDSRGLSRMLIGAECALLPVARWFDREAAPYHAAGVPLLDAVFVPMSHAPAFGSVQLPIHDDVPSTIVEPAAIRRRVGQGYRASSFSGAAQVIAGELGQLTSPDANHLVRHLLESAHRVASLSPGLIGQCGARSLSSPEALLSRLLRLHMWGLTPAHRLDDRARILHARGIPILAQDLPPIPTTSPPADA